MEDLKGKEIPMYWFDKHYANIFLAEIDSNNLTFMGNFLSDPDDKPPYEFVCVNENDPLFEDEDFRKRAYNHALNGAKNGKMQWDQAPREAGGVQGDHGSSSLSVECAFK